MQYATEGLFLRALECPISDHFVDLAIIEINERNLWDVVANMMDDDTREKVHSEFAPCTEEEFLNGYLAISEDDLIIG